MTVSRFKRLVFVDEKDRGIKKQVTSFGAVLSVSCLLSAFLIALYIEYLHNPALHGFIQSKGIFL